MTGFGITIFTYILFTVIRMIMQSIIVSYHTSR